MDLPPIVPQQRQARWWSHQPRTIETPSLTRLKQLIEPALEKSKLDRENRLEAAIRSGLITPQEIFELKSFKSKLKSDKKWIFRHLNSPSLNRENRNKFLEKIQRRIITCQQTFGLSEKESQFLFNSFTDSAATLDLDLHISCACEQILNFITNRKLFLANASGFLLVNQTNILTKMGIENTANISFAIQTASGGDSHNKGKIPLKVTFTWNDTFSNEDKTLIVYLKPRSAQVECKIIDTFKKLNEAKDKDSDFHLPSYEIISFKNKDYSIWENIPGSTGNMQEEQTVGATVLTWSREKRERGGKKLIDLERVCSFLKITDLHPENCIFVEKDDEKGNKEGDIFLIDLEVINTKSHTTELTTKRQRAEGKDPFPRNVDCYDLLSVPNDGEVLPDDQWVYNLYVHFNQEQALILEEAKQALLSMPYRILPIPSDSLYTSLDTYEWCNEVEGVRLPLFVDSVAKGLISLGFPIIYENYLIKSMLENFLNKEVAYFTLNDNIVYNGQLPVAGVIPLDQHFRERGIQV